MKTKMGDGGAMPFPMGFLFASTGHVGQSFRETFFELLMLSPTWIVTASII
jgi:hypothetical protein